MTLITGRTDRQTDGQSATQYAAPPREEGRIIIWLNTHKTGTRKKSSGGPSINTLARGRARWVGRRAFSVADFIYW